LLAQDALFEDLVAVLLLGECHLNHTRGTDASTSSVLVEALKPLLGNDDVDVGVFGEARNDWADELKRVTLAVVVFFILRSVSVMPTRDENLLTSLSLLNYHWELLCRPRICLLDRGHFGDRVIERRSLV